MMLSVPPVTLIAGVTVVLPLVVVEDEIMVQGAPRCVEVNYRSRRDRDSFEQPAGIAPVFVMVAPAQGFGTATFGIAAGTVAVGIARHCAPGQA